MTTLVTGRTSIFTGISIEDFLPNEKIVVSTAFPAGRRFHSVRITYTDILPGTEAFDSLFDIHDFDNVIFISDLLDPLSQKQAESHRLYHVLENCVRHEVSRVILCLPVSALEEGNEERSARSKDLSTTIHFFRDFQNVELQCIYMPYVLNEKDRTNFLYALSNHRASVSDLPWEMNSPAHFIDISSFNDFLRRFFTDDRPGDREMYIDPDFTVSVSDDILQNTALKKYHPAESSSLVGRLRKINEKIHAHEIGSRIASAVGVFAGSVLIEFLMRILSGYSVFQTIDFRNIYPELFMTT